MYQIMRPKGESWAGPRPIQGNSNIRPEIMYQTNESFVPAQAFLPSYSSFTSISAAVVSFTRLSIIYNVALVIWSVCFSESFITSNYSYFGYPTQAGLLFMPIIWYLDRLPSPYPCKLVPLKQPKLCRPLCDSVRACQTCVSKTCNFFLLQYPISFVSCC